MRIRLCVITCMPELFRESVGLALENADNPVQLLGIGNGCLVTTMGLPREKLADRSIVAGEENNRGIPWALHELYELASTRPDASADDVLVYIHDDFLIQEKGWDTRVLDAFRRDEKLGLAGFGGSTGLGRPGLYTAPYAWQQLCRTDFWSNMRDAETHGQRTTVERPIVYTDGQSMLVRRALLDQVNGWSWWPFTIVHHGYDYGIACMARRHGWRAMLIPIACEHKTNANGGIGAATRDSEIYARLAEHFGGDNVVFEQAHRFVYDHFRDVLPLRLP